MGGWAQISDDTLVTRLQRAAFSYFLDYADAENGLVADTSREGSPCSIAVVGFALSCYPVAVENGWLPRAEAAARTLKALRFLARSRQSEAPDATGYKGFYYHFLDMRTGRRVWQCELSLIDTALLTAGILVAGCYFDGGNEETEIRERADALYRRVDWRWAQNGTTGLTQGWKPECGFLHYGWEGYNEATILYVLGLGSPTFALTPGGYERWSLTYQWENLLDRDVLYSGPLFTHLFSHAWIDFRGIRDAFMREKSSDYFENTRSAIAIHREYGERNHAARGASRPAGRRALLPPLANQPSLQYRPASRRSCGRPNRLLSCHAVDHLMGPGHTEHATPTSGALRTDDGNIVYPAATDRSDKWQNRDRREPC